MTLETEEFKSLKKRKEREQLHALITKAWWPFDRADPKVLNLIHRTIVDRKTKTTDLPPALF